MSAPLCAYDAPMRTLALVAVAVLVGGCGGREPPDGEADAGPPPPDPVTFTCTSVGQCAAALHVVRGNDSCQSDQDCIDDEVDGQVCVVAATNDAGVELHGCVTIQSSFDACPEGSGRTNARRLDGETIELCALEGLDCEEGLCHGPLFDTLARRSD